MQSTKCPCGRTYYAQNTVNRCPECGRPPPAIVEHAETEPPTVERDQAALAHYLSTVEHE